MRLKFKYIKELPDDILFFRVPINRVNRKLLRNIKPISKFTSYGKDTVVYIAIPKWIEYNKDLEEFMINFNERNVDIRNISITATVGDLIYILQKIPSNIYYNIDIPNNDEYILPNWYQNCTVAEKVEFTNWLEDSQKYPTQSQPLDKACNINICGEPGNIIKFCDELLKMRSDLDILVQQLKQILENNEKSSN